MKRARILDVSSAIVALALGACSSSSAPSGAQPSSATEEGGSEASVGSGEGDAASRDAGGSGGHAVDAGISADAAPGYEAGSLQPDGSAMVDSSATVDSPSGVDSGNEAATPEAGAMCTDPTCNCAGYHPCATGCCPFTTTTFLDSSSGLGVAQLAIAVAGDGTIHAAFYDGVLVHVSNPGGVPEIDYLPGGGYAQIPTGFALDSHGNPVVSFWDGSSPWLFGVFAWDGSAWSESGAGTYGPTDALSSISLGYDPAGNLHLLYTLGDPADGTPQVVGLSAGPGPSFTFAEEAAASSSTAHGFDPFGNPFISTWSGQLPAQVQLQRYQSGTWATNTFAAQSLAPTPELAGSVDPAGDATFLFEGYDVFGPSGETDETLPAPPGARYYSEPVTAPNGAVAFLADSGFGTTEYVFLRTTAGWVVGNIGALGTPADAAIAMGPNGLPVVCWTPALPPNGSQPLLCSKW